jgi:hypothetical protein
MNRWKKNVKESSTEWQSEYKSHGRDKNRERGKRWLRTKKYIYTSKKIF